jgi:hypothetical protein
VYVCKYMDKNHSLQHVPYHTKVLEGMNMESCHIGGSICAERSALAQLNLRFRSKHEHTRPVVTHLYIVSDSKAILSPGLSCRELLLEFVGLDVPVVCASRVLASDAAAEGDSKRAQSSSLSSSSSSSSSCSSVQTEYNNVFLTTTLRELYPHVPHYLGVRVADIPKRVAAIKPAAVPESHAFHRLYARALARARQEASEREATALYDVHYAAAVQVDIQGGVADGEAPHTHTSEQWSVVTVQQQTLEFMFTLDPVSIAVPQVLAWLQAHTHTHKSATVRFVLTDQHGLLHAPGSSARAHLTEHLVSHMGVREASFLMHDELQAYAVREVNMDHLVPETPTISHSCH